MKVSGFNPITHVLIIAGLSAAVTGLLFIGNSATVHADSTYNPSASVWYCNNLFSDFPGNPYKIAMGVDTQLAGEGDTESGTVESGTLTTLTDNVPAAPFTAGALVGRNVSITNGTGAGQARIITGNTTTELTVAPAWDTAPDSSSVYNVGCGPENLAANSTTGAVTLKYDIPAGDLNFAPPSIVSFIPNGVTINETGDEGVNDGLPGGAGGDIPIGEKVGGFKSLATLGTLNTGCDAGFSVPFKLYNGALPNGSPNPRPDTEGGNSTNIAFPRNQGQPDRFGAWAVGAPPANGGANNVSFEGTLPAAMADGSTLAVLNYPSYLLDLFDPDGATRTDTNVLNDNVDLGPNLPPVIPIAIYIGMTVPTPASEDWVDLFFVQFGAGDLADPDGDGLAPPRGTDTTLDGFQPPHPLAEFTADLGQPNIAVLQDPSGTVTSVSVINDFCTPLSTEAVLLNKTPGNFTRAKNAPAGTGFHLSWSMSYRDLDQDGRENNYDACPHTPSAPSFTDTDGDLLHLECDPDDSNTTDDFDNDGFKNGQDNCPQVANGLVAGNPTSTTQVQDEINQSYAIAAPDSGPKTDQMGDACEGLTNVGGPGATQWANKNYGTVTFTQNDVTTMVDTAADVSNGRFHVTGNVIAKCFDVGVTKTDADRDGYCAEDEDPFDAPVPVCPAGPPNCPEFRHAPWSGGLLSLDTDGDGDGDFMESYLGTDGARPCADTLANPLPDGDEGPLDNWSLDFDDNRRAAIGDVQRYIAVFNLPTTTPALRRFDLNSDGLAGLGDVTKFIAVFNTLCTPFYTPQQ